MRRAGLIAAGIAAGLLGALIWTWAQPDRYRADARVLVRGTEPSRVMPAVEALAESSLVEENVAQTLHLSSPPDVSAEIGKGGVLTVSVEAGSRERARQLDAEAVIILMQKIPQRFAATPGISTTVLDPAHAAEQTSPTPGSNFLIAGLAGVAAGIAAAFAFRRGGRAPTEVPAVDPEVESRLLARVDEVARRERALARRAGELAAREHALEQREKEEPAEPPPPPPPAPVEPPPPPPPQPPVIEGWNTHRLEALIRERDDVDRAQRDEWASYLFFLRQHADPDGNVPPAFDELLSDVFGDLVRADDRRE